MPRMANTSSYDVNQLYTTRIIDDLAFIPENGWNRLTGHCPLLSYNFLRALHDSGCATEETGWKPQFITMWQGSSLVGALPLYLKMHSYGEYVFDWAWAEAYQRNGLYYYPKLLSAIPFSPIAGPRLLAATVELQATLINQARDLVQQLEVSSLHFLFPDEKQAFEMQKQGLMLRHGVQFHWVNEGYKSFDEFLASFSHDKRKRIKQERRKVTQAGIEFRWLPGKDINESNWKFFVDCYRLTYQQHQSTPYLNLDFFLQLGGRMPQNLLLVVAMRAGKPIACSLNIHDAHTLYGRYWGATEYHSCLHFEACYYQTIEFCIANAIQVFEGGAQGEHKLARGFLPTKTYSAHWLAHPQFAQAVDQYLTREAKGVANYTNELHEHSPFKQNLSELQSTTIRRKGVV